MTDLTTWLLERIAEDLHDADQFHERGCSIEQSFGECDCGHPARVLAQCEAMRAVVEMHAPVEVYREQPLVCTVCVQTDDSGDFIVSRPEDAWPCPTLRALASIWADHPEFRQEWKS
jgi:hypothetical protein